MKKIKVAVIDYLEESLLEEDILGDCAEVKCLHAKNEDEIHDYIEEADAIILYHHVTVTCRSLNRMKNVKIIVRAGVGFDNIDIVAAGRLGIVVANVPDYGTNDVADHTIALMLSLVRKIHVFHEALENNTTSNWQPGVAGEISRLTDTKLGIVGLGRIGTAVALRAKAFGMHVSFFDPYIESGWDKALALKRFSDLHELVSVSDFISIHTPLTGETKNMFNKELLLSCKSDATLLNVSRGEIVSLDAVYDALFSNRLRAFGTDVLEIEPPAHDHPLIKAYNQRAGFLKGRLLITPHMAFYAKESREELRRKSALAILSMINNKPIENCINYSFLQNSQVIVNTNYAHSQ